MQNVLLLKVLLRNDIFTIYILIVIAKPPHDHENMVALESYECQISLVYLQACML